MSNISDAQIVTAFTHTNFGHANHRRLLEQSVLKTLVGYHCGHTITTIMADLGLIGKTGKPTKKGQAFVAHAFAAQMVNGG